MLQTRRSDDPVDRRPRARGNFDAIIDEDVKTARVLELAPYGAEADVSGEGAEAFVEGLRESPVVGASDDHRIHRALA